MSDVCCYYYDAEHNRCRCYVNKNLDELLAENAKLRERVDAAHMSRLLTENENEELRELTQQMFALIANHEETGYMDGELGRQIVNAVYERMKELGIEVTE